MSDASLLLLATTNTELSAAARPLSSQHPNKAVKSSE